MENTVIFEGNETFQVPCAVVDHHLQKAPEGALKLLLFLLRNGTRAFLLEDLKTALALSEEEIEKYFSFWIKAGVLFRAGGRYYLERPKVSTSDVMRYSADSVSQRMQNDDGLKFLYEKAEEVLKKPLTAEDSSLILSLTDWIGLPDEAALLLIEYYGSEGKSLRAIHKIAVEWIEKGITSYELAEQEIEQANLRKQASAKIAKLLGISGRALTAAEKRLFDKWKDLDLSLIAEAYERSVQNTGKYAYNYMDKILDAWVGAGYRTAEDVATSEEKPKTAGKQKNRRKTAKKVTIDKDAVSSIEWEILSHAGNGSSGSPDAS